MAKTKKPSAGSGKRSRSGKASAPKGAVRKVGKKTSKVKAPATRKSRAAEPKKEAKAVKARVPRKTHLGKKHLDEFREMLLQRRRTLIGDLNGMEEQAVNHQSNGNLSSMPTHMADVGTDNFEHEFTLGLLENEQALLREINQALKRIEERTYGVCLGTGHRIPLARLRAKPWARYTVKYARMIEQGLVSPSEADEENGTVPADEEK